MVIKLRRWRGDHVLASINGEMQRRSPPLSSGKTNMRRSDLDSQHIRAYQKAQQRVHFVWVLWCHHHISPDAAPLPTQEELPWALVGPDTTHPPWPRTVSLCAIRQTVLVPEMQKQQTEKLFLSVDPKHTTITHLLLRPIRQVQSNKN